VKRYLILGNSQYVREWQRAHNIAPRQVRQVADLRDTMGYGEGDVQFVVAPAQCLPRVGAAIYRLRALYPEHRCSLCPS
jgi:hypothetical protein